MDDLYFIEAPGGRIKIGRAKDPYKRLKALQTASADELELIEVLVGRGYEEKVWHWAFCASRLKGEWFEFTDEMDHAIACAMLGKPWWDHLTPPPNFPLSDDPGEWDDDFVDWQIGVHIALAGAAEKGSNGVAVVASVYSGEAVANEIVDAHNAVSSNEARLREALERIARADVGLQGLIEDGEDTPENVANYYAGQIERRRRIAREALAKIDAPTGSRVDG